MPDDERYQFREIEQIFHQPPHSWKVELNGKELKTFVSNEQPGAIVIGEWLIVTVKNWQKHIEIYKTPYTAK